MVALPCSTLGRRCLPNSQELVIPPQTAAPCAGSCPAAAVPFMQYTLHLSGVQEFFNSKDTATIIIDPLLLRRITNLLKFFVYQVLHQLLLLLKSTTVLKEMIHLPKLEVLQIRNKIYKVEQFYT
jgi:hypothetical protein